MYRMFTLIILWILVVSFAQATYTLEKSHRTHSKIDRMQKGVIADMKNIPQDPAFYAKQIKPFSKSKQNKRDKQFNKKYFKPWHTRGMNINKQDLGWEVRFIKRSPIYRSNGSVIRPSVYNQWVYNANYKDVDSKRYKAITTKRTNVRALPTDHAFYRDPRKTGEGFPFNYNQNSALHINIPLHISHFSRDNRWAFVHASYSFGWVKVSDLALVGSKFIKRFENGNYAVVIKDNMRLYNEAHKSQSLVKLGAIFPISKDGKSFLVATRTATGQGKIKRVRAKSKNVIAKKPFAFTAKNVAMVAKEFYGEPYGWGGSYECRDCSATTRDFLGVFGIFLRRNSSKQAKDGYSTRIKNWPKSYKKEFIIKKAEPFKSLLYVPGHIVLYLGQYKGEPIIMHTYWGVRKNNGSKLVTGRTIITTTEPGKERSEVRERSKLINTLKTIVNF